MQARVWLLPLMIFLAACQSGPKEYSSNVKITRMDVVRRDASGAPVTTDVEVSYEECPGFQHEVVRGGREFSVCMQKYKLDQVVPVKIVHAPADSGYLDSKIHAIGDCPRPPDPRDEASFQVVRDCTPLLVNGVEVGFECKYLGKKELNKKCPWFRRR
jgi:hypothetical protein